MSVLENLGGGVPEDKVTPKKRVHCCISVDIDAVSGWLGSYGGEDSTSDISRGVFAGTVGVRRLLTLFSRFNIKTTWFIPGHSLETFPEECAMIRDAGHEIGLHGYSHENPTAMNLEQQTAIMDKTYKLLQDFCGKPPRGIVAPWWESSKEGSELLLKYGVEYDHSFSHHDCRCYWLRTGDEWDKIDYNAHPDKWMHPLRKGKNTGLVEIPSNCVISHINKHPGVEWLTMEQICDEFKKENTPPNGAWLPAEKDAILKDPDLKLKEQE
ncbi:MAG: hypothetical protein M1831_001163 [Alyxoria varia]|nr:MAG: hypothetical protein M1831_001163 [Alyxoria varia]